MLPQAFPYQEIPKSSVRSVRRVASAYLAALLVGAQPLCAVDFFWNDGGNPDEDFSTDANWTGSTLPTNGTNSRLFFTAGDAANNDLVSLEVNRIQFSTGLSAFNVTGNEIILNNDGGTPRITMVTTNDVTISNDIDLNGQNLQFRTSGSPGDITFSGDITSASNGMLTKFGNNTVTLSGNNSFASRIRIRGGTIISSGANSLSGVGVYFDNTTFSETLRITTVDQTYSGVLQTENSANHRGTVEVDSGINFTLNGSEGLEWLQATGQIAKEGDGTLTIAAPSLSGTDDGDLLINDGLVSLQNVNGLGIASGTTSVASGATLEINGTLGTIVEEGDIAGTGSASQGALFNTNGDNTLSGDWDLTGNVTIGSDTGDTLTFTGDITGAATEDVTFSGAGTIVLSANMSFQGESIISNGTTLRITDSGALGDTTNATTLQAGSNLELGSITGTVAEAIVFANGATTGTLQNNSGDSNTLSGAIALNNTTTASTINVAGSSNTLTLSGAISGAGDLNKSGDGILTLSGNNTFTGDIDITSDTLRITHVNGLGTTAGTTTVADNATLELNGTLGTIAEDGSIVGNGDLAQGAIFNTGGDNTLSGNWDLTGASTVIGSDTGSTLTISGDITGAASEDLAFNGSGDIILTSDLSFQGDLTIANNTTVRITHNSALGDTTGDTTIAAGGTLELGNITGDVTENITFGVLFATGTLRNISGNDNTISGNVALNNTIVASTINVAGASDTLTLSGIVSGAGILNKTGSGTLTLSGNNTFTGGVDISAGTIRVENANGLGTTGGSTTMAAGTELQAALTSGAIAETLTLNNGASATTLSTAAGFDSTFSGNITLNNTTSGVQLEAGTNDVLTFTGILSGAAGIDITGAGDVVLAGANTFTGGVTISNGTLTVETSNALGTTAGNTTINSGAELEVAIDGSLAENIVFADGVSASTLSNLSGTDNTLTGTIALNNTTSDNTFTVSGSSDTLTVSGNISGTGALNKSGDGTLVLSGSGSTYSGATTISGGTLSITHADALGATSGTTTIAPGGTLELDFIGGTFDENILFSNGSPTGTLSNATGADRQVDGTLTFNNTTTASTLFVDTGDTLTFTNNLTGSGDWIKDGAGDINIATTSPANSTFDGELVIREGAIFVGTDANPTANGIVFGQTSSSENYLGVGDITIEDGGELYVYSNQASDFVEFRNDNFIESGGQVVVETRAGSDNEIRFFDHFTVGEGGVLYAETEGDSDINIQTDATFESLGKITMISGDDIEFFGRTEINGGNLTFVSFDDFETSSANDNATISVTGGAAIDVLTAFDYIGTGTWRTSGGTGSLFELKSDDTIRVEDNGSTFNIYTDDNAVIRGEVVWRGGNQFQVLRANQTIIHSTATLDGGIATEKGTFVVSGDLNIAGTPTTDDLPNFIITTEQYTATFDDTHEFCPEFTFSIEDSFASSTVSGQALTGLGEFAKQGPGTTNLTLSNLGAQTIDVQNGILTTNADNQIVAGADLEIGTSTTSGTLDITNDDHSFADATITQGNVYTGNGTLTFTGSDITKVANDTAGIIAVDAAQTGLADVTFSATDLTITVNDGAATDDLLIDANISGSTNVTKEGDGRLTINGTSTYSGNTIVNAGTLDVQELNDTSSVTVNNSGSVLIINDNETIGSLAGTGGQVQISSNTLTTGGNNSDTTFAGDINGSGDVVKNGTGTMTLSGSNTLTGDVTINNGAIALANSSGTSLGSINQVTIASGAQLVLQEDNQINTVADLILDGGELVLDDTTGNNDFDETLANIILTDDSGITYGGNSALLTFNGGNFNSNELLITDWDGSVNGGGAHQLIFDATFAAGLGSGDIDFAGFNAGFTTLNLGGGLVEILPTFNAVIFEWTGGTSGQTDQWDQNDNWNSTPDNDYPQEAGDYVLFNDTGSSFTTLALDGDFTIGFMEFSEDTDYTIGDDGSTRTIRFDTGDGLTSRFTLSGTGEQTIDVDIDHDDSDGLILAQNSTGDLTLNGDFQNDFDLIVRGSGLTTLNGTLAGSGDLTKSGNGVLQINSTSNTSFSGDVAVDSGALIIDGSDSLGTGTTAITVGSASATADAQLLLSNGSNSTDLTRDITIVASPQDTILGGNHTTGTSEFSGDISLGQNTFLTAAGTGTVNFTGQITGANGLDKIGSGTVVLDDSAAGGSSSFSGGSTIQAGTVQANTTTSLGSLGSNAWTMSENTTLDLNYTGGTGLSSGNIVVNGGVAGATIERIITGTGDTGLLGSSGTLTINGAGTVVNTDTGASAGNLEIGGSVIVTTGSTLTLQTSVSGSNDSTIVFNDATSGSITIREGATVQTAGGGRIDFGDGSNAIDIIGEGTMANESRLVLDNTTDFSNANSSTALIVNGEECNGLEIEGTSGQLTSLLNLGTASSRLNTLTGTGGTLTLRATDNTLTVGEGPSASSNVNLGLGSNAAGTTITINLDATGGDLDNYNGIVVKDNSADTSSNPADTTEFTATTRVEVINGDIDLSGQTNSTFYLKEGIADLNSNNITVAGTATIENGDVVGDSTSTLTADTIRINASSDFTSTVGVVLDASGGTGIIVDQGTLLFDGGSIANGTDVDMSGGIVNWGDHQPSGSDVLGTLTLTEASRFNFGTNDHTITFANSRNELWIGGAGDYLWIDDWSGSLSGGGSDQLLFEFGAGSNFGVNNIQLAQIRFADPAGLSGIYSARILSTGEIVPDTFIAPIPEPTTIVMGVMACALLGFHYYRRKRPPL